MDAATRAAIEAEARRDATTFVAEFGRVAVETDWAAEAWAMAPRELRAVDERTNALGWATYLAALRRAVGEG